MNWLVQIGIIVFTGGGLFLSTSMKRAVRKSGYVFVLIGQVFWFMSMDSTTQWGMWILSLCLTFVYINGLKNNWKN